MQQAGGGAPGVCSGRTSKHAGQGRREWQRSEMTQEISGEKDNKNYMIKVCVAIIVIHIYILLTYSFINYLIFAVLASIDSFKV